MENPWIDLKRSPWCVDRDKAAVDGFNARASADYRLRVHTTLPEPFIGDLVHAAVIICLANPGWTEADDEAHTNPLLRNAILGCVTNQPGCQHHYYLSEELADTPGGRWWRMKTKAIRSEVGHGRVQERLGIAEWLPYRSHRFKPLLVSSAAYTHQLVADAVERDAWLIVRSRRQWEQTVPSMRDYPRAVSFKSQNASISPRNLPDGVFDAICEAL